MASTKRFSVKAYPLEQYQKPGSIVFPKEIPIALAVCSVKCGGRQFIVDGGTQICEYCGHSMFRTEVRTYSIQLASREAKSAVTGKRNLQKKEPNHAVQRTSATPPPLT